MRITKSDHTVYWILLTAFIILLYTVGQFVGNLYSRLGGILLLSPVFGMLLWYIIHNKGVIRYHVNAYIVYMILFALFCVASSLWAADRSLALKKGIDIAETAVMMIVILSCMGGRKPVDHFLKVICAASYLVVAYEIAYYGWSYYIRVFSDSSRITSDMLNSNTLGLCVAYAIIINVYLLIYRKVGWWTAVCILIGTIVLGSTGSRKALIAMAGGVFLLFVLKSCESRDALKAFCKVFSVIAVLLIAGYFVLQLPVFSGIMNRMRGLLGSLGSDKGLSAEKSAVLRQSLSRLGVTLFKRKPILGVGMDCPRLFSFEAVGIENYYLHNNFAEVLAGGGLMGVIAYYWIYALLLIKYIRNRDFSNPQYNVCLILLLLQIVLDYGMVSYYSKLQYLYLMLLYVQANKLENRLPNGKKLTEGWKTFEQSCIR